MAGNFRVWIQTRVLTNQGSRSIPVTLETVILVLKYIYIYIY